VTIQNGVTKIGASAFSHCEKLKEVSIPESVVEIGSCAFENTKIETITLPKSITNIAAMAFRRLRESSKS
jgi:hypothetical protein